MGLGAPQSSHQGTRVAIAIRVGLLGRFCTCGKSMRVTFSSSSIRRLNSLKSPERGVGLRRERPAVR